MHLTAQRFRPRLTVQTAAPRTYTPGYSTTQPSYIPPNPYPTDDYPYDPYEPYDPYDPYPYYFCELNEDEYGRPYYGPYDEYRQSNRLSSTYYPLPTRSPYTTSYPPTSFPPVHIRPIFTAALPPPETYRLDLERVAANGQVLTLPRCIKSNECRKRPGKC